MIELEQIDLHFCQRINSGLGIQRTSQSSAMRIHCQFLVISFFISIIQTRGSNSSKKDLSRSSVVAPRIDAASGHGYPAIDAYYYLVLSHYQEVAVQTQVGREMVDASQVSRKRKASETLSFDTKTRAMQFESLADDVMLELFTYFNIVHLLRVFAGVNSRFNSLLLEHFRSYHLDLRRIPKPDFDDLCRRYLPSILDRIASCQMSHQDETPGLVSLFLSRGFNLHQFTRLKSLTLRNIQSADILRSIGQLRDLVHLDMTGCHMFPEEYNAIDMINSIWSLPRLKCYKITGCFLSNSFVNGDTIISPNLEYLCIDCAGVPVKSMDLLYLFTYAPQLRFLSLNVALPDSNEKLPRFQTSITTLKLRFYDATVDPVNIFQSTPCLRHLTIRLDRRFLNGNQWQELITQYLPNLETLRFTAIDFWRGIPGNYQEVEEQLDTFRTPFWLEKHQWYVCCDWEGDPTADAGYKQFYTLPYMLDYFPDFAKGIRRSTSTCSHLDKHWSFRHVRKFECRSTDTSRQYQYPVAFLNIENLQLSLPQPDIIWRMIPSLNHLTKLYMTISAEESDSRIQMLIERARRLDTLIVRLLGSISKIDVLFRVRNPSIRRIRLLPFARCPWPDFDEARCTAFAHSPIARQCEFLEIRVAKPECILTLSNAMTHLRSMVIHLTDDHNKTPRPSIAGFTEWVQNHLPRRFRISNCEVTCFSVAMKLWIGAD